MKSASEQFVTDYISVVENDQEAWDDLIQMTRVFQGNMVSISEVIKHDYETMVSTVIGAVREELPSAAVNLLAELLFGWGSKEFDTIAKYAIEADKEVA
jgi:hypothetical protein